MIRLTKALHRRWLAAWTIGLGLLLYADSIPIYLRFGDNSYRALHYSLNDEIKYRQLDQKQCQRDFEESIHTLEKPIPPEEQKLRLDILDACKHEFAVLDVRSAAYDLKVKFVGAWIAILFLPYSLIFLINWVDDLVPDATESDNSIAARIRAAFKEKR